MSIHTKTRSQIQRELGDLQHSLTAHAKDPRTRNSSQIRAAQMILSSKINAKDNLAQFGDNFNNIAEGREQYQGTMHRSASNGAEITRLIAARPEKLNQKRIKQDWEAQLPNDRSHYQNSPVARHNSRVIGAFSPERFMTRTFNRKMKMRDTFT